MDPTFDSDGKVTTSIGAMNYVSDVAIQPDSKIVVAGVAAEYINNVFTGDIALTRYNPDGSLDTSFGKGGKVVLVESGNQVGGSLSIQPDGKIIVLGDGQSVFGQSALTVLRFNPDGSLDTTFGTNGKVVHNVEQASDPGDSVLQPDGKIVISATVRTGEITIRLAVFRLNTNGSLDTSFNSVGYSLAPPGAGIGNYGFCVALQSDGKIIAGGPEANNTFGYWGRFNGDGTFEGTSLTQSTVAIYGVAVQQDGKIVFAGRTPVPNSGRTNFSITRFKSDKTLDAQFGNVGINSVDWGTGNGLFNSARTVFIQPGGRIVVGGTAYFQNYDFGLARFNSNGFLDLGFGDNGKVVTRFDENWEEISGLAQQSDGKIVAVGYAKTGENTVDFALARYDGSDSGTLGNRTPFDYDGDGRVDVSVFRPSTSIWYHLFSENLSVGERKFGTTGDILAPGDYDGDSKTDFGIFRPSNCQWWYLASSNNTLGIIPWGQSGDIPLPANFDGDGKADLIVYRPSNNSWIRRGSVFGQNSTITFGIAEDKPLIGDFDGDGRSDLAVFRPSTGDWWYASSISGQFVAVHWGAAGDIPVPGDYDADGKTDFVVYRPSNGTWYILRSGEQNYTIVPFGLAGDKPVAADFDGDGKADIALFRPSTGTWYLLQTTAGFGAVQWGASGDIPTENSFLP